MKVFYSSSFFGGFLFLIRSPTKNPLTFGRKCQMVIFALSNRAMVSTFYKNLPPKKVLHFEKSRLKIPLVMGWPHLKNSKSSHKNWFANIVESMGRIDYRCFCFLSGFSNSYCWSSCYYPSKFEFYLYSSWHNHFLSLCYQWT